MADNLTIESSNAGQLAKDLVEQKKRLDSGDPSISRLLNLGISEDEIAKLLDSGVPKEQIAAVFFNRARLSKAQALDESKEAYAQSIAQEVVTSKSANSAKSNALKTAGIEETQGVDGLTNVQRQDVTSNPEGHVYLPAPASTPIDAEQAKTLLDGTMLNFMIGENGLPLTSEAINATIENTPTKDSSTSVNSPSFNRFNAPTPMVMENTSSALNTPGSTANLSLNLKNQKTTGVGGSTGGLSSSLGVGDVSINSGKLFSMLTQFLFDHQEELQEIMKDQRELRNEMAETALQALKTLKAFKEQEIRKQELEAIQTAVERLVAIPQEMAKADVGRATGTGEPNAQVEELQKQIKDAQTNREENDPLRGANRTLLSSGEIQSFPGGQDGYNAHLNDLMQSRGFDFAGELRYEQGQLQEKLNEVKTSGSPAETAELEQLIKEYENRITTVEEHNRTQFNRAIKSDMHTAVACQTIDRLDQQLTGIEENLSQIDQDLSAVENKLSATPPPEGDALNNLQNEKQSLLEQKSNLEKQQFVTSYQYTQTVHGLQNRLSVDVGQSDINRALANGKDKPITPELADQPALAEVNPLKTLVPFAGPKAPEITGHASEGARDYYNAIVDDGGNLLLNDMAQIEKRLQEIDNELGATPPPEEEKRANLNKERAGLLHEKVGLELKDGQIPENFSDFRQAGNNIARGVASQVGNLNERDAVDRALQSLFYIGDISEETKRFAEEQGYESLGKTQELRRAADAKFKKSIRQINGMINQLVALQYRTFRS